MKSNLLLALGLLASVAFTSCSLNDGVQEQTLSSQMSQLIIPDDASKDVTCQRNCLFVMKMDLQTGIMDVSASDLTINGSKGNLSLPSVKYTYSYNSFAESYFFTNGTGNFANTTPVENVKGYLTSLIPSFRGQYMLVMSYRTNGATVKTFSSTPLFSGTTTTTYPMSPDPAVNTDALYGIVFADDMKTATVVIYNIQFAPGAPKLESVILKDVDVNFDRNGYKLVLADRTVPEVSEGGSTTPYENFPFTAFTLSTVNDELTEVKCEYEVEATMGGNTMTFNGEFTGKSADYIRTAQTEK